MTARSLLSRAALGVAVLLALVWGAAYWRLEPLEPQLFQLSWSGPRALAHYLRGDLAAAARLYRDGLRGAAALDYRDDPSGYWALRSGDRTVAEQRARATLALVPSAVEPLITLGEIQLDQGDAPAALEPLRAALGRQREHVDALYLAAIAEARTGRTDEAIALLGRGLRQGVLGERDVTLFRVMELAGELAARPSAERPLCLLAQIHRYLRIFDGHQARVAVRYATEAIAAGDRPADAWLVLAVMHDKRWEFVAARDAAGQALRANPRHPEALRWAAMAAGKDGDLVAQYRMTRAAFEAAPRDPFYIRDLEAVVLDRLGDPHTMAALMQQALAADPVNAEAHRAFARAAGMLGDRALARAHRNRAAESRAVGPAGRAP